MVPLVFCASCAYMLWSSLSYVSSQTLGGLNAAWIGVAVLAVGIVALGNLTEADLSGDTAALASMAPGDSAVLYYETTLDGDLTNTAGATGTPC